MPKKSEAKESVKEERKKISQAEFEKQVIELAKKGLTAEKIGEQLRKQKIHSKEFSKKISAILKENNLYKNPDETNVEKKLEKINSHIQKNKQDKKAKREKDRIFSQLRKIRKYLKKI